MVEKMDSFLGKIGDHVLMYDKRQFVLSHPVGCPERGSAYDRGRTYHGYWLIEESLADCGLSISAQLFERMKAVCKEHEQTKCGYAIKAKKKAADTSKPQEQELDDIYA
jgi:hypothetical protein